MNKENIKYRIELTCVSFTNKRREVHRYPFKGRATDKRAHEFLVGMNKSLLPGGANDHLNGTQSNYSNAYIINQQTGKTVASYISPAFQVA